MQASPAVASFTRIRGMPTEAAVDALRAARLHVVINLNGNPDPNPNPDPDPDPNPNPSPSPKPNPNPNPHPNPNQARRVLLLSGTPLPLQP